MSLPATPPRATPINVRKGDKGWLVYSVQKSLGVTADGVFGTQTEEAVRKDQAAAHVVVDGIVGPVTQRVYAREATAVGEAAASLPAGLLRGLVENESGLMLCAVNWSVGGGVDCGIVQRRVYGPPYDFPALKLAFDPVGSARTAARDTYTEAQRFANHHLSSPYNKWQLAVLDHNWPWAADRFEKYGSLGESGKKIATWAPASLQPITWNKWANFYIMQATRYVRF